MTERVTIESIAAGGAGVARLRDGRVAFVARTAPGDVVDVQVVEQKRRYVRAEPLRVIDASAQRREAPCPYYARCGGCTIEHMQYAAQLEAKRTIVRDALRRIGGVDVDVPPVEPSPAEFRYRNRVSFALRRIGAYRVVAGFHDRLRADRVLDMDGACLLPEPAVAAGWNALRAGWGRNASRLPSGDRLRLTLRGTAAGALTLLVEGGYGAGNAAELLDEVPALRSVWQRRLPDEPALLLAGADHVEEDWHGEHVLLGGAVFLQVNRATARALEAHVLERVAPRSGMRVVDAYCGVALHARRCARAGAEVAGIELDPHATADARRALPDARIVQARVEDALPELLPADVVIVNPPRAGLAAEAAAALTARPPERLVYVSCDPATLARDAHRMAPALRLGGVQCFDMFPQTTHVETVAEFECVTT